MLKFNYERIFRIRAIKNPSQFLIRRGFSENFATRLKYNQIKRVNPAQLEQLCLVLRCTPNDLFEWHPDPDLHTDREHPLYELHRPRKVFDLTKSLQKIPLDQIDEIEEIINERINARGLEKNQAREKNQVKKNVQAQENIQGRENIQAKEE